ncbi:MAG TPA: phosphatase PAP2 family protein [Actinomycetota bacterium]|nr:phosphatase PAP2 family protein [Actinomycetota bacterium]
MRPRDIGQIAVGAALFEVSRRLARRPQVGRLEEDVFRAANGASDRLRVPVRGVMQAGTFVTVPLAAGAALAIGRRGLAERLAIAGTAAWFLARLVKPLAGRPRPALVLEGVRIRERIEGNLGWVSGHAAVSTTLAALIAPETRRPVRLVLAGIVATTGFGRMYVGAHLPLDIVGGVGVGLIVSGISRVGRGTTPSACLGSRSAACGSALPAARESPGCVPAEPAERR